MNVYQIQKGHGSLCGRIEKIKTQIRANDMAGHVGACGAEAQEGCKIIRNVPWLEAMTCNEDVTDKLLCQRH